MVFLILILTPDNIDIRYKGPGLGLGVLFPEVASDGFAVHGPMKKGFKAHDEEIHILIKPILRHESRMGEI